MKECNDYDKLFSSLGGKLVSLLEMRDTIDFLGHPSNRLILDIGTGTGRIAQVLLELDNKVVGIDINSRRLGCGLKKLERRFGAKMQNYCVVLAHGQYLPFREGIFDEILLIRTLKYLERPERCFLEVTRTLKHKGICVMELSNCFGYEALWLFLLKLFRIGSERDQSMGANYMLFNAFKVEELMRTFGLTIVRKKAWHKIPTYFFVKCDNPTMLQLLMYAESALRKLSPFALFSRGILLKFRKM